MCSRLTSTWSTPPTWWKELTVDDSIPVSAAFDLDYEGPTQEQIEKIREEGALTAEGLGLSGELPIEYWREAASNVTRSLRPALSTPMTSILADGWNKYRGFL